MVAQNRSARGRNPFARLGSCLFAIAAIGLCAASCENPKSRFPVCQKDADCLDDEQPDKVAFCKDLRCVECRYDDDCPSGSICKLADKTCSVLDPHRRPEPPPSKKPKPALDEGDATDTSLEEDGEEP